jgi:molecular chaperone DnaK (HSP70)
LVSEAERHRQADLQKKEVRRLKNRLEGLIYNNERVFGQFQDALPEEDRQKVNEVLLRSRMAMAEDSRAELEAAMYDLNAVSRLLSDAMLKASQSRA